MKQVIRIIGGLYRGKKLHVPLVDGLRPTPDRVRETLFNWLMHSIRNARCLDAFAGTGALGLEAFSRGASRVVFLEQSPQAFTHLKQVISQWDSPKLQLIKTDTLVYLQQQTEPFDLIFLDPPFAQDLITPCLNYILQNKLLTPGGLVYLESPKPIALEPLHWQEIKAKQAGQVYFGLFKPV